MLKKILLITISLLLIIQFFKPSKNSVAGKQKNTLSNAYSMSGSVKQILEKACIDCHSNNTQYPWYSKIQPIAWWLNNHIVDGKKHFNLDEFLSYQPKKQDHKMEELIEMIKKAEMPLKSYTWIHTTARLSDQERYELTDWASLVRKEITLKTGFVSSHQ